MITLLQYAGQNITPENDASVYNALARGANSCLTSIQANLNEAGNIAFTDGYMLIQGRVVHLESHVVTPVLPDTGTATGTIYIEIDITNTSAPCQIKTVLGAFTPVMNDINLGGTLYQLKIGTYSATPTQVVSNSLAITLPNNADVSFGLGFKDTTTGKIQMGAYQTGAFLDFYDRGENGQRRVSLFTSLDSGVLFLKDPAGKTKFVASGGTSGGQIYCKHATDIGDSKNAVELGARGTGADSTGYFELSDKNGTTKVEFDGEDGCSFFNNVGTLIAKITFDSDGGKLGIYNKDGNERIRLGIKSDGGGKITIWDKDGNERQL